MDSFIGSLEGTDDDFLPLRMFETEKQYRKYLRRAIFSSTRGVPLPELEDRLKKVIQRNKDNVTRKCLNLPRSTDFDNSTLLSDELQQAVQLVFDKAIENYTCDSFIIEFRKREEVMSKWKMNKNFENKLTDHENYYYPPTIYLPSNDIYLNELLLLDYVIGSEYDRSKMDNASFSRVTAAISRIEENLRANYYWGSRLTIFGSLINGFGTKSSDVDICFRFEYDHPPPHIGEVTALTGIADVLCNWFDLDLQLISTAKVPIIKFKFLQENNEINLEGDISYYNSLALLNSDLLKHYTLWDSRVAPLGIFVKQWAKHCDICNASKGTLSSYALMIMVIHYLQNCNPPIVPRLQEEFRLPNTSELLDGYDVYFCRYVLPNWSKNRSTLAQLFVGFLGYYAYIFPFVDVVIQIRQEKPLLKTEKMWRGVIAIEDPFNLEHNLGSAVYDKRSKHEFFNFCKEID